ncbi:MAG: endonuclease [Myxococcales bacterium]|nr:endonuclease [Myxococcales bacterium]
MYPRVAGRLRRLPWIALGLAVAASCGDNRGAPIDAGDGGVIDADLRDAPDRDAADTDAPATDAPDLDAPATDAPDLDAVAADAPDLDAPDLDAPDVDAPDVDAAPIDAPDLDAPAIDAIPIDAPELPLPVTLRVMASNLTSGNFQAYEAPGARLIDGLDPDIALMQEFNVGGNTPAEVRAFVDQAFGPGFYISREAGVQIPNGVVSRYPIVADGRWDDPQVGNREFVFARIDIPGPRDLWAVSVHLLTSGAGVRNSEATALAQYVTANVPPGDFLVIGGDFNTDTRSEACIGTIGAVVDTAAPHPADQAGDGDTNAGRTKPYDWVLPDADLRPYQTAVAVGTLSYPDGLVLDTRVYTPLADVAPAMLTDSAASNMQHMGVIKAFTITE